MKWSNKKNIFVLWLLISFFMISCSSKINFLKNISGENLSVPEFKMDENNNLLGAFNRDLLFEKFPSFQKSYQEYNPSIEIINKISQLHPSVDVLIVLGTWCPDSRQHVGEFFKVIDKANLKWDILLIGIDRHKIYPRKVIDRFHIERVPTFVFFKDRNEIGRIIEHPKNSMEKDILELLVK